MNFHLFSANMLELLCSNLLRYYLKILDIFYLKILDIFCVLLRFCIRPIFVSCTTNLYQRNTIYQLKDFSNVPQFAIIHPFKDKSIYRYLKSSIVRVICVVISANGFVFCNTEYPTLSIGIHCNK